MLHKTNSLIHICLWKVHNTKNTSPTVKPVEYCWNCNKEVKQYFVRFFFFLFSISTKPKNPKHISKLMKNDHSPADQSDCWLINEFCNLIHWIIWEVTTTSGSMSDINDSSLLFSCYTAHNSGLQQALWDNFGS